MLFITNLKKSAHQLMGLASLLVVCAGCSTAPIAPKELTADQRARLEQWHSAVELAKPSFPVLRIAMIRSPAADAQAFKLAQSAVKSRNPDLQPLVAAGGEILYVGVMPVQNMPVCNRNSRPAQGPSYCLEGGDIQFLMPVADAPVLVPGHPTLHDFRITQPPGSFHNACYNGTCYIGQVLPDSVLF